MGLVASLLIIPARLQREADDDAAYRAVMREIGAEPKFPHDSEKREKEIIAGEILAHLVTISVAYMVWRVHPVFLHVFLGAWAAAFIADWMGGKIATWNFNRRQPSASEIFSAGGDGEGEVDEDA
jgi:hypothetical protein